MNNFSKLSLYDFLGMMIPGFIIMWFFHFLNINLENPINDILIAILCYLIGMCYHKCIELVVTITHLRRNKCLQVKAWKKFYEQIKIDKNCLQDIDDEYVSSYYLIAQKGCLMNIPVLEAQETFLRNIIPLLIISVPYVCCWFHDMENLCCICILLLVLIIGGIICWFCISKKIYYLVWEGEYYLNKNGNSSLNSPKRASITKDSSDTNTQDNEKTDN